MSDNEQEERPHGSAPPKTNCALQFLAIAGKHKQITGLVYSDTQRWQCRSYTSCWQSVYLNVFFCDQPRSVSQQLVQLS